MRSCEELDPVENLDQLGILKLRICEPQQCVAGASRGFPYLSPEQLGKSPSWTLGAPRAVCRPRQSLSNVSPGHLGKSPI